MGYDISKELYRCKGNLSSKTNDIFDLQDKIRFYYLPNTYFERRKAGSKIKIEAYGRSKENRCDAKIVSIAAVINAKKIASINNFII